MNEVYELRDCQMKLAILWLVGSALPLFSMLILTLRDYWGGKEQEAWGWLLPAVIPILTLIVGSVAATGDQNVSRDVPKLTYRVALWLSFFYLFAVIFTLGMTPYDADHLKPLHKSSWMLGAIQGLIGTSMGVFFSSARSRTRAAGP
jgi:hypothetical protein